MKANAQSKVQKATPPPSAKQSRRVDATGSRRNHEHGPRNGKSAESSSKLAFRSDKDPFEIEAWEMAQRFTTFKSDFSDNSGIPSASLRQVGSLKPKSARSLTAESSENLRAALPYGRPLPSTQRNELEVFFQKDLSSVRIHADEKAATLAGAANARAFAAGAHIFFAKGQYETNAAEPSPLLVHETAHALQQGLDYRGGIHDFIQLDGPDEKTPTYTDPLFEIYGTTFEDMEPAMVKLHTDGKATLKDSYKAWYDPLKSVLRDSSKGEGDRKIAIESAIATIKKSSSVDAFSLLGDLLRLTGNYKYVVLVLIENQEIETFFPSRAVEEALENNASMQSLLENTVRSSDYSKFFWPRALQSMLKAYGRYSYYSAHKRKRYFTYKGTNGLSMKKTLDAHKASTTVRTKLNPNELKIYGLKTLRHYEEQLLKYFEHIDAEIYGPEPKPGEKKKEKENLDQNDPLAQHRLSLQRLLDQAHHLYNEALPAPLGWYNPMLGELIEKTIRPVSDFWERARLHEATRFDRGEFDTLVNTEDAVGELYHTESGFADLADTYANSLYKHARSFFQVDNSNPNSLVSIFANTPRQAEAFIEYADKQIIALLDEKAKAKTDSPRERGAALLARVFSRLRIDLYETTDAGLGRVDAPFRIDAIILNRQHVALNLRLLANQMVKDLPQTIDGTATDSKRPKPNVAHWKKLDDMARDVRLGVFDITSSQIVIPEDYIKDYGADLDKFKEEVSELSDIPIHVATVVNFYNLKYNNILIEALKNAYNAQIKAIADATTEESKPSVSLLWSISAATNEVEAKEKAGLFKRPERYYVGNTLWIPGKDKGVNAFKNRLIPHERTKRLEAKAKSEKKFLIYKYDPVFNPATKTHESVIWAFPNRDSFISPLRDIALLNGIVAVVRKKSPEHFNKQVETANPKVPGSKDKTTYTIKSEFVELIAAAEKESKKPGLNSDLDDWKWLEYLAEYPALANAANVGDLLTKTYDKVSADYQESLKNRKLYLRMATSVDRNLIGLNAGDGIKALLDKFDSSDVRTYRHVSTAIDYIDKFEFSVAPNEDREDQVNLLLLQVAPQLKAVWYDRDGPYQKDIFWKLSKASRLGGRSIQLDPSIFKFNRSFVEKQIPVLQQIRGAIISRLRSSQQMFGIQASLTGNSFHSNIGGPKVLGGEPTDDEDEDTQRGYFRLDGYEIYLERVVQDFSYFPPMGFQTDNPEIAKDIYGVKPALFKTKDHEEYPETITEDMLFKDPETLLAVVKVRFGKNEQEIPIRVKDQNKEFGGLHWLSNIVHAKANLNSLDNLATVIEGFRQGMMFVLSFTPAAPAVLAVEALETIMMLQNNDGLKKDITDMMSDPQAILDKIGGFFESKLTSDFIFSALINGDFDVSAFIRDTSQPPKAKSPSGRKRGIAKLFANVRKLGSVIALRMQAFRNSVQVPVQALSNVVVSRPLLSRIVAFVGNNIGQPIELILLSDPYIGPIYEFILKNKDKLEALVKSGGGDIDLGMIDSQVSSIAEPINKVLDGMTHFEFPKQIVPTQELLTALIDLLIHVLPKRIPSVKGKIAAQLLVTGGDLIGLPERAGAMMYHIVRDMDMDPNTYWENDILPKFKVPAETMIQDFGGALNNFLKDTPILGNFIGTEPLKVPTSVNVQSNAEHDSLFDKVEEPTAAQTADDSEVFPPNHAPKVDYRTGNIMGEPSLDRQAKPAAPSSLSATRRLAHSAGQPLPSELKSGAEKSFGHSLNRVRLHQNSDSHALNQFNRSFALTSGSHIFLRGDVNPRHPQGKSILDHEIAHTLQNASSAPGSSSPIPARTGANIDFSPQKERGAETMRRHARAGNGPVPIVGSGDNGYAPAFDLTLFGSFLGNLSDFRGISGRKIDLEKETTPKKQDTGAAVVDTAEAIYAELMKHGTKTDGKIALASFLEKGGVADPVKAFLKTRLNDSASPALSVIVKRLAHKHRAKNRKKPGEKPDAKPTYHLRETTFKADLFGYIFAKTGLQLSFVDFKSKEKAGSAVPEISADAIKINYLDLHLSEPFKTNPDLNTIWSKAIENTFNKPSTANPTPKAFTKGVTQGYKDAALAVLEKIWSPGTDSYLLIWESQKLEFADTFKDLIVAQKAPSKLDKTKVPPWGVFIQKTRSEAKTLASSSTFSGKRNVGSLDPNVGMFLGTHGEFKTTKKSDSYGLGSADRQSHHTTQYLLPEYFFCDKRDVPFKKGVDYPGLNRTAGTFTNLKDNSKKIEIKKTFGGSNRGEPMPAILLSGFSHLNSDLHMTPKADDNEETSQGYAIHFVYGQKVPASIGPNVKDSATMRKNIGARSESSAQEKEKGASEDIYNAIVDTYKWMRDKMSKNLIKNMPANEFAHYKKAALGEPADNANFDALKIDERGARIGEDKMKEQLKARAREVYEGDNNHNDTVMESLGWKWKR